MVGCLLTPLTFTPSPIRDVGGAELTTMLYTLFAAAALSIADFTEHDYAAHRVCVLHHAEPAHALFDNAAPAKPCAALTQSHPCDDDA